MWLVMSVSAMALCRECRGSALWRNFEAMKVLRLTAEQVHDMPWQELEDNMKKWNEHMHIGVRTDIPLTT